MSPSQSNSTDAKLDNAKPMYEYASSCAIPTEWIDLPLHNVSPCNHDSNIFEFALPEPEKSLELPSCACILLSPGKDEDGNDIVRPYTPISGNSMKGKFQLLVKRYPNSKVSGPLHELPVGATVRFKHIPFNMKIQYPFHKKTITMITGGSGITPMLQALRLLLETEGDETQVLMLNGNKTEEDILMKNELDAYALHWCHRFKVIHCLSRSIPEGWKGETGRINEEMIQKHCAPPSPDTKVFVCGLPALYQTVCGPREEKSVAKDSALWNLGYTDEMIFKF